MPLLQKSAFQLKRDSEQRYLGDLIFCNPAVFQTHDPGAVSGIHFGVRNLNDSCAFVVKAFEHVHDLFALAGVEVPRRLVSQNYSWRRHHRASDANQLLLTT